MDRCGIGALYVGSGAGLEEVVFSIRICSVSRPQKESLMREARTQAHENHVAMPVGFGVRPAQRDALGRGSLLPRMSWIL
jgi:hypothetical protein